MKGRCCKYWFVLIQSLLYITFLTLDIKGGNVILSNYIKFTVVVLCLLYVLIKGSESHDRQLLFLCYALFFTLISDILILLLDYYFYGVLTFIIAQQLHGIRISILGKYDKINANSENTSHKVILIKDLVIRLFYQALTSLVVCLLLWKVGITINDLLAASAFYFFSILTNVVRSLRLVILFRDRRNIKYLAIGMVLFLLCDINVGLFNLSDFLTVGSAYNKIYLISSILMWTFYAPSQVLISLSGDDF